MEETSTIVIALYGLIGATGALSLLVYAWGFATYISRLGTVRREEGIETMRLSVGLAIAMIVLIGILRFVENWLLL
jgi:hypothetical protein